MSKMFEYRNLGKTGISVSPYGIGSVKFGRNEQVKYPNSFELPSDKELLNLLALAKNYGVNLIDTAPAYGIAQKRIGRLLKSERLDWVYVSKVGENFDKKSSFDFSGASAIRTIKNTLCELKTDFLDVILIHSDGSDIDILEESDLVETLLKLKEEGLVRAVGMSPKTTLGGLRCLEHLDVAMVTLNIQDSKNLPVITRASEQEKGILIKKGFCSGHINNQSEIDESLSYIFEQNGVSSLVVGTINESHMQDNLESLEKTLKRLNVLGGK